MKVNRLLQVVVLKDIQGALQAEGVSIHEGDVVLIRTGHAI